MRGTGAPPSPVGRARMRVQGRTCRHVQHFAGLLPVGGSVLAMVVGTTVTGGSWPRGIPFGRPGRQWARLLRDGRGLSALP